MSFYKKDILFIQRDDANTLYETVDISGSDAIIYIDHEGHISASKIWKFPYVWPSASIATSSLTSSYSLYAESTANPSFTGKTDNYFPIWQSNQLSANSLIYQNVNKIGISTTSPSELLHVNGNILSTALTSSRALFTNIASGVPINTNYSIFANNLMAISGSNAGLVIFDRYDADISSVGMFSVSGSFRFYVNGNDKFIFNSSNRSITASRFSGTSSYADAGFSSSYAITASYVPFSTPTFTGKTNNYVPIWINNIPSGTGSLYANASQVGINTNNPTETLHVNGNILSSALTASRGLFTYIGSGVAYNTNYSVFANNLMAVTGSNAGLVLFDRYDSDVSSVGMYSTSGSFRFYIGGSDKFVFNGYNSSITASRFSGTSSYADKAFSSSYAITASYVPSATPSFTGKTNNYVPVWINNVLSATSSIYSTDDQVGINTNNPTETLHVNGNILSTALTSSRALFTYVGAGAPYNTNYSIFANNLVAITGSNAGLVIFDRQDSDVSSVGMFSLSGSFRFYIGGSDKFVFNGSNSSITASRFSGTSSYADKAFSSSYAVSASYAPTSAPTFTGKTNNYAPVWINNVLSATSSIYANASQVGINTNNPGTFLDVFASGENEANSPSIRLQAPDSGGFDGYIAGATSNWTFDGNRGKKFIFTYGSLSAANTILGISGSGELQVVGGAGAAIPIRIGGTAGYSGYNQIYLNGLISDPGNYNFISQPGTPDLMINRPSGYNIWFRENNSNQMAILTGGNVGIGTTSFSNRKLYVWEQDTTTTSGEIFGVQVYKSTSGDGSQRLTGVHATAVGIGSFRNYTSPIVGLEVTSSLGNTTSTSSLVVGANIGAINTGGKISDIRSLNLRNDLLSSPSGGLVTSATVLYINSIVGTASSKYGVYQSGSSDRNYFAGNVGVGTAPGSYNLSCYSSTLFKATDGATTHIPDTDSNIYLSAGQTYIRDAGDVSYVQYDGDNKRIAFYSGSAVGIGLTAAGIDQHVSVHISGSFKVEVEHQTSASLSPVLDHFVRVYTTGSVYSYWIPVYRSTFGT